MDINKVIDDITGMVSEAYDNNRIGDPFDLVALKEYLGRMLWYIREVKEEERRFQEGEYTICVASCGSADSDWLKKHKDDVILRPLSSPARVVTKQDIPMMEVRRSTESYITPDHAPSHVLGGTLQKLDGQRLEREKFELTMDLYRQICERYIVRLENRAEHLKADLEYGRIGKSLYLDYINALSRVKELVTGLTELK